MADKTQIVEEIEAEVDMKADKDAPKDKKSEKDDKKDECECEGGMEKDKKEIGEASERIVQPYTTPDTISEDVALMFNGQELSEEFKKKATVIFEAALAVRVNAEIEKIEEEAQEAIIVKLAEAEAETNAKIDAYMEEVVAEWAEENKIAIETGIRQEIAESFITDLKALFEKHNIEIPQEKVDMLEASDAENEQLRQEISALSDKLVESDEKMFEMEKSTVLKTLSEGLAVTQVEKFNSLIKEVDAKSIESFKEKAAILRDSMFSEAKPAPKMEEVKVKPLSESKENDRMEKIYASMKQTNKKD